MISIELSTIIPAIFFLVLAYIIFAYGLWLCINALMVILPGFLRLFFLLIPWLIILIFLGFSWQAILLVFFGILLFLGFGTINRNQPRKATGAIDEPDPNPEKRGVEESETSPTKTTALFAFLNRELRYRKNWLLLYLLLTAIMSSVALGRITAVTRTKFSVADISPRCAIVYTTANRYICKPFTENEFENAFKVLYLKESQTIEFPIEEIGPLQQNTIP